VPYHTLSSIHPPPLPSRPGLHSQRHSKKGKVRSCYKPTTYIHLALYLINAHHTTSVVGRAHSDRYKMQCTTQRSRGLIPNIECIPATRNGWIPTDSNDFVKPRRYAKCVNMPSGSHMKSPHCCKTLSNFSHSPNGNRNNPKPKPVFEEKRNLNQKLFKTSIPMTFRKVVHSNITFKTTVVHTIIQLIIDFFNTNFNQRSNHTVKELRN
jgi:hypothetical protein